ncbi:hypothetical protein [Glacieibacterium frigidum]|uniref:Arc-like DNA binding domain-containing protein n=1 Tax=Glacieibacterium frigidum TaxID=2593303 RepID=A0A552U9A1_9SPHN|nr:hypothetical protein [Glacieibacterium frigidum]TRW14804.1 hypothetical protein FMM06_14090 [Glacieibacterium frigidum]
MSMRAPDGQLPQIKVRVSDELRSKLEASARDKGWPVNREINARLEATYSNEDRFGSRANAAIFQVIGQAIHELEQRVGRRWTGDYAVWRAARDVAIAYVDQLRPPPDEAARIAELRQSELNAEAELRKAAEEYNQEYSPLFDDNFQPIYPWDQQIVAGTFESQPGDEGHQIQRTAYRKVFDLNENLIAIRHQIQRITIPQVEQHRMYSKIAHELLENLLKKSEDG